MERVAICRAVTNVGGGHILTKRVGERQKFLHTRNVRVPEAEPEGLFPPLEADVQPERRVRGKQPQPSMRQANVLDRAALEEKSRDILKEWSPSQARKLADAWALGEDRKELKFGMFRHGGVVGRFKDTDRHPNFSKLLAKLILHYAPDATFTSLVLSVQHQLPHFDAHNDPFSSNVVLPLKMPVRGGHHWMELRNGDIVTGGVQALTDVKGSTYYGTVSKLQALQPAYLDPRRRHGVTEWVGDRVVLVGYTVRTLGRDMSESVAWLQSLGFNVPEHMPAARLYEEEEFDPGAQVFALSVESPEEQIKLHAFANDAAQSPAEADSPPQHSQEEMLSYQAGDRSSLVKEGGWTESVALAGKEVEFNVHWDFRVKDRKQRSPARDCPSRSHSESVKEHRRRDPPKRDRPLPSLPDGWSVEANSGSTVCSPGPAQGFNEQVTSDSESHPPLLTGTDLLRVRVAEEADVWVAPESQLPAYLLCKAEPAYLEGPEEVLAALTEPLQVVHTISPKDVSMHAEKWLPAIKKELGTIEPAIQRVRPGDDDQYQKLLGSPEAVRIPAKLVYTLKPPNQGSITGGSQGSPQSSPDGFFRRKARIVGCGNYAQRSHLDVYASGSVPEAFRILLTESAYRQVVVRHS